MYSVELHSHFILLLIGVGTAKVSTLTVPLEAGLLAMMGVTILSLMDSLYFYPLLFVVCVLERMVHFLDSLNHLWIMLFMLGIVVNYYCIYF